ncbi:hypothetical protein RKD27_001333 [Streptomyces sp. SAI-126]|uniref:CIS tube protein n=1 Tax=Streptomyces sp. SAI-126 TaxID=3377732 RepID=UPI003C7E18B3
MSALEPARLFRLDRPHRPSDQAPAPYRPRGKGIVVQFNPTTLRLQYQNNKDIGGKTVQNQTRQSFTVQPATLNFDLEFDTAEAAGTPGRPGETLPSDVRRRTAAVRQFVEPGTEGGGVPPVLRFVWGRFTFTGIATQVTEELDYFAANGTPLRAKLSISITEQNPKYEGFANGPGSRDDRGATPPGGAAPATGGTGAKPGRSGTDGPRRTETAQDGESAQQLAARIGGDPAAWRSLMNDLESPLGLPAGAPVQVGPELTADEGIARAAGFAAGGTSSATERLAQALGLAAPVPSGPAPVGPPDALEAAGFALSQAGGIGRAARSVAAAATERATLAAREAFGAPAPPGGEPDLDPRALAYGRAIPLRTRAHTPTLDDIAEGGRRSLAARARPSEADTGNGSPGLAPWLRLPSATGSRARADDEQRRRDARPSTMRWKPRRG